LKGYEKQNLERTIIGQSKRGGTGARHGGDGHREDCSSGPAWAKSS
jgi:hypothetical protein